MKAKREHRVPLCGRALEVLDAARTLGDGSPLVFPMRSGRAIAMSTLPKMLQYHEIAAAPHGFRSSFRDWAAERTDHPREVIEAALAHVVQNKEVAVDAQEGRADLHGFAAVRARPHARRLRFAMLRAWKGASSEPSAYSPFSSHFVSCS